MKNNIIKLAIKKFEELSKKFDGFNTVFLDDWRGYRFIYDVKKDCSCINGCKKCPLFQLLKSEEEESGFTAGLYVATDDDKKIFGSQKFLNCKSFKEYRDCFVNFILKNCNTKKEVYDELNLAMNVRVIYSKNKYSKIQEEEFKKSVIDKLLKLSDSRKKRIIQEFLKTFHLN